MQVHIAETTDNYEELSPEEKKDYNDAYLRGVAGMEYLTYYDKMSFKDTDKINMDNIYKTVMSICFLRGSIFKDDKPKVGAVKGYDDLLFECNSTLDFITGMVNTVAHKNKSKEYFN